MVIIGVEHYEVAFFTHFDTADRVGTVECSRPIQVRAVIASSTVSCM